MPRHVPRAPMRERWVRPASRWRRFARPTRRAAVYHMKVRARLRQGGTRRVPGLPTCRDFLDHRLRPPLAWSGRTRFLADRVRRPRVDPDRPLPRLRPPGGRVPGPRRALVPIPTMDGHCRQHDGWRALRLTCGSRGHARGLDTGVPRPDLRGGGDDGDHRADGSARVSGLRRVPGRTRHDAGGPGRSGAGRRPDPQVALHRQRARAPHPVRARPSLGPLRRHRRRAAPRALGALAQVRQAGRPLRPGPALLLPHLPGRRGVRVRDVRRRAAARPLRGERVDHGAPRAPS